MYIILVYDMGEKRVGKMLKHCRKYLNWIQNSVFEGEVTEVQIKEMMIGAKKIMNEDEDSIILFKSTDAKWLKKEIYGQEKMETGNFI
jgi:CRISPR-associated protein Cas2